MSVIRPMSHDEIAARYPTAGPDRPLDAGTVHCVECDEPETDLERPFRRIHVGGRPRHVCSWCDYQARREADDDDELGWDDVC